MATNIDELVVRIKADTKQLNAALDKVKKKSKGSTGAMAKLGAAVKAIKGPAKIAAVALAAIGAVIVPIARVGMEFENLKLSLNTVFGSIKQGESAFRRVKQFAKESPFQIRDLTKAFIQLRSAGIEPSEKMFKTFADAASVTIDSLGAFQALVRITQRSAGGGLGLEELNQISDRGIPVFEILKQKLGATRLELTEMGVTAEGAAKIMAALNEGLSERFGGAVASKMETLTQKISNMNDAFSGLADTIFTDFGVGGVLKSATSALGGFATDLDNFLKRFSTGKSQAQLDAKTTREEGDVLFDEQADDQALMDASNNRKSVGFLGIGAGNDASQTDREKIIRRRIQKSMDDRALLILKLEGELIKESRLQQKQARNKDEAEAETTENARLKAITDAAKARREALSSLAEGTILPVKKLKDEIAEMQAIFEGGDVEKIKEAFAGLAPQEVLDTLNAQLTEMKNKITEAGTAAEESSLEEKFGSIKSAVESTVTPFQELQSTIADLQSVIDSKDAVALKFLFGERSPEEIATVMATLTENLKDIGKTAEDTSKTLGTQLQQAVTNAANAFTTNFVNALMEGKNALGSFKDFAKSMVSQIIAIFLQMEIVNRILNAVFSGANQGEGLNLPTSTGFFDTDASGGHYNKGTPTLVGERGPELIIPNTSGTVMNGMNTKNAMGGGDTIVVNQSLNFSTGVVGTVRAEINKMMPTIAEVSKSAVLDATRRGGNYRKGLLGA